jgi:hypothetical protein
LPIQANIHTKEWQILESYSCPNPNANIEKKYIVRAEKHPYVNTYAK